MTPHDKRFLNFPIVLLFQTFANPQAGLTAIWTFSFVSFAARCRRTGAEALVQLAYHAIRRENDPLPIGVERLLQRGDIGGFCEECEEAFLTSADGFEGNALEMLEDDPIQLDPSEQAAIVDWLALHDAANYFGRQIKDKDHEAVRRCAATARQFIERHEAETGPSAYASIPADYFFEVLNKSDANPEAMRFFRMIAAVRSLVGKKLFSGTTKNMLRARMVGAKTPAIVGILAADNPALKAEHEALESRRLFDRLVVEGQARGFYTKYGHYRRIFFSMVAKNHDELAGMVDKKAAKRAALKKAEQRARQLRSSK